MLPETNINFFQNVANSLPELRKRKEMNLKNIYLEKTPLTSTENKYLVESSIKNKYLHDSYSPSCKKLKTGYAVLKREMFMKVSEKHKLPNIRNVENLSKTKKKKMMKRRSLSREAEEDFQDVLDVLYNEETPVGNDYLPATCFGTPVGGIGSLAPSAAPCLFGGQVLSGGVFEGTENAVETVDFSSSCFPQAQSSKSFAMRFGGAGKVAEPFAVSFAGLPILKAPNFNLELAVASEIDVMPIYEFDTIEEVRERESFVSSEMDLVLAQENAIREMKTVKLHLLNAASMALMYSSSLRDPDDSYRQFLLKNAENVLKFDPEFILKVALYTRQELHIRSAANFLLAFSAFCKSTRAFLPKYFESTIVLPSDWIDVAECYLSFNDECLNKRSLPTALKNVMKESFKKFDDYQLAKYNRKKEKKTSTEESKSSFRELKTFTLKQLIRLIHIKEPSDKIMCILGKKYPESHEAFLTSSLTGSWDSSKSGQRMKLPQPVTWETQISLHGNRSDIWESLIDDSKLPYMAMLRNLKNLLLSGVSPKHHEKVLNYLQNKNAVIKSRQSPVQYYEAYKVIGNLKYMAEKKRCPSEGRSRRSTPRWKYIQECKDFARLKNLHMPFLERYKAAIANALEISSQNNLYPIPGKTLVICEASKLQPNAKNKSRDTCFLMGLMCLKAAEDCRLKIISDTQTTQSIVLNENDEFLSIMLKISENFDESTMQNDMSKSLKVILDYYLKPQQVLTEKLDNLIYIKTSNESGMKEHMTSFLFKYRQIVNADLLYTEVDLSLNIRSFPSINFTSDKDVYLYGYSPQLLKFIAERTNGGQLTYIENIDTKYNLKHDVKSVPCPKTHIASDSWTSSLLLNAKVPKWHSVRIFISSTFKDMHSERDLLVRYVMPELRKRAASAFIRVNEVDLRWGIAEGDCDKDCVAELCLSEAQNCDIFVGILGERYGTIHNFESLDDPNLQWVKDYPAGLSITELEMYAGALRHPDLSQKRAFFYFRNSSFAQFVPGKWKAYFLSENDAAKSKVENLKSNIISSGFKVLNGYPCKWAGIYKGMPVVAGLETFGKTVLEDLWTAVQDIREKDPYLDTIAEEDSYQEDVINSRSVFIGENRAPVKNILNKIKSNSGIFVISGPPGSGKTTFVVHLLQKLNIPVIKFFVGASPRSKDICYLLQYITCCISRHLPVSSVFSNLTKDVINNFPDILVEAVDATSSKELILLIDGLDHLECEDQMLDWLPLFLPEGFRLICTASDTSHAFKVLLERQLNGGVVEVEFVSPLQHGDRETFIRNYLKMYGKSLDESAFNNQMRLLVTRRESGNPYYLKLACDYLRIYASYSDFKYSLQKMPSTAVSLLEHIIVQIENEFGSLTTQTLLTLLCITKEGLDDADLQHLLSFALLKDINCNSDSTDVRAMILRMKSLEPESLCSQVQFYSLLHLIRTFAGSHARSRFLNLAGTEFEKAVIKYYANKSFKTHCRWLHCVLAGYFYVTCDPNCDNTWDGKSSSAYRGLLYHLFYGLRYKELSEVLCSVVGLEAIFNAKVGDVLLDYYSLLYIESKSGKSKITKEIDLELLTQYQQFVSKNLHIFLMYPHLVSQQAMNEQADSNVYRDALDSFHGDTIQCLTRSQMSDYRLATFNGFVKSITAAACDKRGSYAVLGSEDGYLKVLDLSTNKIIRSFRGHVSAITYICFAGDKRVCASSLDTTLSIWNCDDFSRIAVLKEHKHNVSCCCVDLSGLILISSGWDNSLHFWSLLDGRSLSVISDFRCPVNCIHHHPYKQEVACGLWNGNVEIWNSVSMQRRLVFSNFAGSVKSIAYTPDGVNIISAYMHSDIIIWSSEIGLKISKLSGHTLPTKSISFSIDQQHFVSASDDSTLKVWSAEYGNSLKIIVETKFCPVSLLEFLSKNYLAVAFQNSEIWLFDVNSGNAVSKMSLSSDTVTCFSKFNSTYNEMKETWKSWWETTVIFGTLSGKIMVGDSLTSSVSQAGCLYSRITVVAHNENTILCGNENGDIGLFSYPESICSKEIFAAHDGSICALSFFTRYSDICTISIATDNILKFWKIEEFTFDLVCQKEECNRHNDNISCCHFFQTANEDCDYYTSNGLKNFLSGSHDNNVFFWNDSSQKVLQGLQTSVTCINSTDKYIIGCAGDGSIAIWSHDGTILSSIPGIEQSSLVSAYWIDKDSSDEFDVTFAFVSRDGSTEIKKPLQKSYWYSLEGHSKGVNVCCTYENNKILSCSKDGSINIWEVPLEEPDNFMYHSSYITGLIWFDSLALSSDAHGNVILWTSNASGLKYLAMKKYQGGFIRSIVLLKNSKFACAVTQTINHEEKYFLDILYCCRTATSENCSYSLNLDTSYSVENEIACLGSCNGDIVSIGFKTGKVMIISPEGKKLIKVCDDWVLGIGFISTEDEGNVLCVSLPDHTLKLYSLSKILNENRKTLDPLKVIQGTTDVKDITSLTSSMYCDENGVCFIGKTDGYLEIYSQKELKRIIKAHVDSVTGIHVSKGVILTSSLDKTVKGWNYTSLDQVCQFHLSVPICCLSLYQGLSISDPFLIGTTSGVVHLMSYSRSLNSE